MRTTKFFIALYISMFAVASQAQSLWRAIAKDQIPASVNESLRQLPKEYSIYQVPVSQLKAKMTTVMHEDVIAKGTKPIDKIQLPMPLGKIEEYMIWESPILESGIAARYPQIKSYKGYNIKDGTEQVRITITSQGIHAAVIRDGETVYIDPVENDPNTYISYYTKDATDYEYAKTLLCGTDDQMLHKMREGQPKWGLENRSVGDKTELRKFRLALACSGEWGQLRGSKEKALEEMTAFVDRANLVFEKEVALRLVIIDRNDDIIFLNPLLDPYNTPESGGSTVGIHTQILNALIGSNNYEVGHVFLPCTDVGGVAAGLICSPGKGNGVTCYTGQGVNTGTVLVFNHEVGHQMTAGHTWNHCNGSEGQLALGSAYEPGSGSTIMSYAFACGADNLGIGREAYYHSGTLEQILNYTNRQNSEGYICAEKVDVGNFIPDIQTEIRPDLYIPTVTPFYLLGNATDQNNDPMTYIWEQVDADKTVPLGQPEGNCPLFRSYKSTTNPLRLFPNKQSIFSKLWTDVRELLPTYGRDMNFRFCVRDNNPLANGVAMKDFKFKVAPNTGPFQITEPVNSTKVNEGKKITLKWDVANTNLAPINAKYVDILIGYGNSLDFETSNVVMIAEQIPNTGEATVSVPARVSSSARIIIRGHDNIFFTVSGLVNIQQAVSPAHYSSVVNLNAVSCLPQEVSYQINTSAIAGLTENIKFDIEGLPQGAIATWDNSEVAPGESNTVRINVDNVSGTAEYTLGIITYVPGVDTINRPVYLRVTGTDLNDIVLKNPAQGLAGVGPTQRYEWEAKPDATSYTLEVATSPQFRPEDVIITKTTTGLTHLSDVFLDKAKIYFWRVLSSNQCGAGEWSKINTFATAILQCNTIESGNLAIPISGNGPQSIEAPIIIFSTGTVNDVNIKNINISHTFTDDLSAFLVSPSGKSVKLWANKCPLQNVNIGLDDESNLFFACPINTGKTYRPENKLSDLNGEQIEGRWLLKVEDRKAGGSGVFNNWKLELCANITLTPPVLIRNNRLEIYPKDKRSIDRTLLLAEDQNTIPTNLIFTLVDIPAKGMLLLGSTPLTAGSVFSQDDIDKFNLQYIHTADDEVEDIFTFVVSDGEGGFILLNEFVIDVNRLFPSKTDDDKLRESKILLYPNPTSNTFQIELLDSERKNIDWKLDILDIHGKTITSQMITSERTVINVESLLPGVYLAKITVDGRSLIKRLIKS